jgi:hypothetical protein
MVSSGRQRRIGAFGSTRQNDDRTAIQPYSLHASVIAAASNRSQSGMNLNAHDKTNLWDSPMGKGILLWLIGVPIPIILPVMLLWH